jgi:hypothetical protein
MQSILEANEVEVDVMHITPSSQEITGYAQFQAPEYQPSVSPSGTINQQADNVSLAGSLVISGSENKQSINSPQNV